MSAGSKYQNVKKKPGKTKAFFICLLIASFLWLAHSLNTVYTFTFNIPVSFSNIPRNKKPLVQIPETLSVDVKASGLKLVLMLINRPYRQLDIDFNSLKSVNRNQNYVLSSSNLEFRKVFRFETQVRNISPDTIYFSDYNGYQKTVPVKAMLFVKCREGYGFKPPVVSPAYVTIWGDTGAIINTDTIYTQPLTLTNLNMNVNTSLEFVKPDREVYAAINQADVFIEVDRLIEKTVHLDVKDRHDVPNREVNIFPSRVKVRFTSVQNSFRESDTAMFKAIIDTEKINRATKKYPVLLSSVPANVNIISIEPSELEVLIFKKSK